MDRATDYGDILCDGLAVRSLAMLTPRSVGRTCRAPSTSLDLREALLFAR
jgi:hypothetical protein